MVHSNSIIIGKNDTQYFTDSIKVGRSQSARIKKIKNGPFQEVVTKMIADSERDWVETPLRKQLTKSSGFNMKGWIFLSHQFHFTTNDFMTLYDVEKKFKQELKETYKPIKEIYGAALRMRNRLVIRNRLEFYNLNVRIHLIKINDLD